MTVWAKIRQGYDKITAFRLQDHGWWFLLMVFLASFFAGLFREATPRRLHVPIGAAILFLIAVPSVYKKFRKWESSPVKRSVATVKVQIVRFMQENKPGWVECRLTDAWGREWAFIDKLLMFTCEDLDAESLYPVPGEIRCQIIRREQDEQGREIVIIDTEKPDHVEAISGETQFAVLPQQFAEIDT